MFSFNVRLNLSTTRRRLQHMCQSVCHHEARAEKVGLLLLFDVGKEKTPCFCCLG